MAELMNFNETRSSEFRWISSGTVRIFRICSSVSGGKSAHFFLRWFFLSTVTPLFPRPFVLQPKIQVFSSWPWMTFQVHFLTKPASDSKNRFFFYCFLIYCHSVKVRQSADEKFFQIFKFLAANVICKWRRCVPIIPLISRWKKF